MKRTKIREIAPNAVIPAGFVSLSSTMFRFACEMAARSETGEFVPKIAYPMAAVVHAAGALEAFLNERLEMIVTTWGESWDATLESLDRIDTTKKWIVFPRLLHGRTFDIGAEPFQSLCGLVELRNALVHYRPVSTAEIYVPPKVERLRSKFRFDAYENQDWTSKVLTPSCARWSCKVARDMVRGYFTISGQADLCSARRNHVASPLGETAQARKAALEQS